MTSTNASVCRLTTVTGAAVAIARAASITSREAMLTLAECAESGKLPARLFHMGTAQDEHPLAIEGTEALDRWRSLRAELRKRRFDANPLPPAGSTWLIHADDLRVLEQSVRAEDGAFAAAVLAVAECEHGGDEPVMPQQLKPQPEGRTAELLEQFLRLSGEDAERFMDNLPARELSMLMHWADSCESPTATVASLHQGACVKRNALDAPLPPEPQQTGSEPSGLALTTPQLADAFDGIELDAQKWRKRLGDLKNHAWLTPARVTPSRAPNPATWCPLKFGALLLARDAPPDSLRRAFLTPALKPWRAQWQEATRERNGFGQ